MVKNVFRSGIITSGLAFLFIIVMLFVQSAAAAGSPSISNITAAPDITDITNPVLSATISDTSFNITNATFYIGENSNNKSDMTPVDGAFDSGFENVTGTINISGLAEGVYGVTISTWNTNGSRTDNNTSSFIVDKTPPLVWLKSPANLSYIHQNISIEFSIYDVSPVTANYSIKSPLENFTNETNIPLGADFKINTSGWNESEYDITVWVKDSLGRTNSTDIRIYIDNTCPNLTILEPDIVYATTLQTITIYGITDKDANLTLNGFTLLHDMGVFSIERNLLLGPNKFYINATDNASNINSSVLTITRYLLVKAKAEGGSSGGSGGTGEDFNNIAETQTQRTSIFKDEHVSFRFERVLNPIIYINFTAKVSAGKVASKIEVLRNTSTIAKKTVPGVVYRNVNIWVGNLGWANEKSISDATIVFLVPTDWLSSHQLNENDISLYRFSGVSWSQLPTSIIGVDAKYVYYASKTPSFSPFAISGSYPAGKASEMPISPAQVATPAATPPVNDNENISSALDPHVSDNNKQSKKVRSWVVLIVGVLCVVSSFYPRKNEILNKIADIRLKYWR